MFIIYFYIHHKKKKKATKIENETLYCKDHNIYTLESELNLLLLF